MDPISSNGQAQSTATVQDQRSAKVEATPTFQTPVKQPLVPPPMPVTGGSQIAAVVRGMISGEVDPAETQKTEEEKKPERILKPYGMDMLPEIKKQEIADHSKAETESSEDSDEEEFRLTAPKEQQSEPADDAPVVSRTEPAEVPEQPQPPEERPPEQTQPQKE